jgi:dTMP kinase
LKPRGVFITLEGTDGTGKSTQLRLLVERLRKSGFPVRATREPGGTRMGEQVRRILLEGTGIGSRESGIGKNSGLPTPDSPLPTPDPLSPLAELALMYAARAQHLEEVVRPALARGEIVVSDRFNDASVAYQGYGRRLGPKVVRAFDRIICGRTQPDLTLLLDVEPRAALERAARRENRRHSRGSRFEAEGVKFHERVRAGYLAIAGKEPQRVRLIRADQPVAEVAREIAGAVDRFLKGRHSGKKTKSRKSP